MSTITEIPEDLRRELVAAAQRPWDTRPLLRRIGDAISQLFNVFPLLGMPDESISGRSYRLTVLAEGKPPLFWVLIRWAAEALFWIADRGNHCQLAFWEDIYRARSRAAVANDIAEAIRLQTWGSGDSLPPSTSIPTEQA